MLLKTRLAALTLLLMMALPTFCFAVELPSGAVKGLPSRLIVLDEDGNSPNSLGEYFVDVEDMLPEVEYSKQVSIMNLREDAQYHVYFSAEHYAKYGTIDLENEVECCIYLDDKQIYKGLVNGNGDRDISKTALDLGNYKPNESATLKATFVWHPSADSQAQMNLYDTAVYGQVDFKWIFYASVGSDTGGGSGGGTTPSGGGSGGGGKSHSFTSETVTEQTTSSDTTGTDDSDTVVSENATDETETSTSEVVTSTDTSDNPPGSDIIKKVIEKLPGGKVLTGAENGDFAVIIILYISVVLLVALAAYVAYRQHKLNKRKNT